MCRLKPGLTYNFPKDQEIYDTKRINLSRTSATSSSTPSPSSSARSDSSSSEISKGVIASIVLGALVGIALILGAILFFLRRKRNSSKAMATASNDRGNGQHEMGNGKSYDSMSQQKHTYSYQPVEVIQTTQSRAELGAYNAPGELHASPTTTH
jgi:LPXTG-motif cell wall-anchored protein